MTADSGGIQHNSEINSVCASFTPTSPAPELLSVDSTESGKVWNLSFTGLYAAKDLNFFFLIFASNFCVQEPGTTSQLLPSPVTTERFGSSALEPSLSTRDALDKYHIFSQKVGYYCIFYFLVGSYHSSLEMVHDEHLLIYTVCCIMVILYIVLNAPIKWVSVGVWYRTMFCNLDA